MTKNRHDRKKGRTASLSFHINNEGSSLVLVVVIMFVVMLLGVAILYSSYTSVLLRSSQRKSEKTFTSAETGMEIIKEGLGEINSDAVAQGYKTLLSSFSNSDTANKTTFNNAYMAEITKPENQLFTGIKTGLNGTIESFDWYKVDALSKYLEDRNKAGTSYTVQAIVNGNPSEDGIGRVHITKNNNIILRGVRLIYKSGGYEEQITTDFRLSIPSASISTQYVGFNDALKDYTIIADQGLLMYRYGEGGGGLDSSTFEGSAYAGKAVLNNGVLNVPKNGQLTIGRTRTVTLDKQTKTNADGTIEDVKDENGRIQYSITPARRGASEIRSSGDIVFTGNSASPGTVEVQDGGTLWANNIELKGGSKLTSGNGSHIYIRNDLNFKTGGTATLKGSYFGFGNGNTPMESSSIIFNQVQNGAGFNSTLDISGIDSLVIAGKSFIQESSRGGNSGMGSSITTRQEQLAYLLPESLFNTLTGSSTTDTNVTYSNPRIIASNSDEADNLINDKALNSIDEKKFDSKIDGLSKKLSDYGITDQWKDIKTLTYNVPGNPDQCVRYYFLDFNGNQQNANEYFKDYFRNNSETVNSYISNYATLNGFNKDGARIRANGTTLEGTEGKYNVADGGGVTADEANTISTRYNNLSDTLNPGTSGKTTPFYTFINVNELRHLCVRKDSGTVPEATQKNPVDSENGGNVQVRCYWGNLVIGGTPGTYNGIQYTAKGSYNNTSLVYVVDGDVRIEGNYGGIVMCSGTLQLGISHIVKNEHGIRALKETDLWNGSRGSSEPSETKEWKDVTYENWKKD